jgi:PBP1b-binding outer membrane lipoprotein LpoB|tara:strand:- start:938 stop:1537 length:600 start_codon:yes stop_codon:yes gene_type:complete
MRGLMLGSVLLAGSVGAGLVGCSTPARVIETGGPESVVSVGEVDIQDLKNASAGMLESLISTNILNSAPNQPARLAIDRVVNDTSSSFDTGELLYRMREQLVNSGKAQVITTYGNNPESKIAQDELRRKAMQEGRSDFATLTPDFALTGKVTQLKRAAGSTRQTTYTFRLTLTDIPTGLEAWTKTVEITKLGTKNSVGF